MCFFEFSFLKFHIKKLNLKSNYKKEKLKSYVI